MVHERDEKYEVQDDGEYHFSDDQGNYEVDPSATQVAIEPVDTKARFMAFGAQYKRPLMGLGGFFLLIFVVYKILAPATSAPTTDIAQVSTSAPTQAKRVNPAPITQTPKSEVTAAPLSTPVSAPAASSLMGAPVVSSVTPETSAPAPAVTVVPASTPELGAPVTTTVTTTVNPTTSAPLAEVASQTISDYQEQTNAMQGKLQDMSLRLASMETAITRLGQMIQELKTTKTAYAPRVMAKPFVPKVTYTVQAIIPGRAWLKSETGDTVTVTEGDTLQGYGRIIKIDPYDGVVRIDVGSKIISLSYGSGND